MKLTTIALEHGPVPAALLTSGKLVDLAAAAEAGLIGPGRVAALADILDINSPTCQATRKFVDRLESNDGALLDQLASLAALHDEETATYAPMLRPGLLFACGMAYHAHLKEMGITAPPPEPSGFMKSPNSIIANNQPIVLPAFDPDMVDFECELACVIGRPLYQATPAEAMASIAGYTLLNDVSLRTAAAGWAEALKGTDPGKASRFHKGIINGKQLATFGPLGPVIETADTFGDPADFRIETRLNGELMQVGESTDLVFSIGHSLAYFSQWYGFMPGDVFSTGSPAGVGFARNPPRMLRGGDVVELSCQKIGLLSNPVVAEKA